MNHTALSDTFPVTPYNPKSLMPVSWLNEEWTKNRVLAWEVLNDDLGGLNKIERAVAPFASLFLLLNLLLLTFNLQAALSAGENLAETLGSPLVLPMTAVTIACLVVIRKFTNTARQLRDKADSTIFLTVTSWVQRRYNESIDFSDNLASILEGNQPVRPTFGPYLDVTYEHGEKVLILRDASSGAEVKNL